jgi:UPF0755 protein
VIPLLGAFLVYLVVLNQTSGSSKKYKLAFPVYPGDTGKAVATRLETAGIINSGLLGQILLRYYKLDRQLTSGLYLLDGSQRTTDIIKTIGSPGQLGQKVLVRAGSTLGQIAVSFENANISSYEDFITTTSDPDLLHELGIPGETMEGYIYPSTYHFAAVLPLEDKLRYLATCSRRSLASLDPGITTMSRDEVHNLVTLASIIEREYRRPEEAPLIASVFYNRLEVGMPLQSCATIIYILTEEFGLPRPERLYMQDLAIHSQHNTYLTPGLPPGPICNPGPTALAAATQPASTQFFYFSLVDEITGEHHFAEYIEDHLAALGSYSIP